MPIRREQMGDKEEVFSWSSPKRDELLHFAAGRLSAYCAGIKYPVKQVALTKELVGRVATQNGIEPDHFDRIAADRLHEPVTMLDMGDGTHVICDGSHRLIKRAMLGFDYVDAYDVPERVWRRFTIVGMPGEASQWGEYLGSQNPFSGRY